MLVRAGPIRDEYWSLSRPMRVHLARSAMTAAHHTPRTRPPLLAPVLAIVTPHSNIAVVLVNHYLLYLLSTTHSRTRTRTPSADKISKFSYFTHKQNIKQLHRCGNADITSSDILVAVQSYPHPLSSQVSDIAHLACLEHYQLQEQGRCEEYVHV